MTSTRALDEKHQKILRELLQEKANKRCFDCIQKGPVYANVTIGTFICTQCSGIHRELNHRVKSISMSTFTPEEIEKMKSIGNAQAEQKWRPNWNPSEYPLPDPSDTSYIRKFIYMTYDKKAFCSKERKQSKDTTKKTKRKKSIREGKSSISNPEPLTSLLGNNIPSIEINTQPQQQHQQQQKPQTSIQDSLIDLFDTPPTTSYTTSPSKSNPLGDLSSLYAQGGNMYSSTTPGYSVQQQQTVNPFSQNMSFGTTTTTQQNPKSKEIEELTTMIRQLQEAISLRQQQITIGQQNYAQLTPEQKNQLLIMMQTQQAHQQKLIEATQKLNSMTMSNQSSTTPSHSFNPFGQQQQQQQTGYGNNVSLDGLFSSNQTSTLNYGYNSNNYNQPQQQKQTDLFSGLTTKSNTTDFNPFG